ncbi:hypothetical protein LWI28_012673 [Acer negundo]|uniref:UBL3-like ubiquitin domain-containing protein n=1 Tax=Acer negundo TaxID=4023 RepID=A0AAD5I6T5_ACENE|nr:hypothetical protein LWI28_012673 [Acer negundo]
MAGGQDQIEIKFRLTDGSDIGPRSFPAATSVANLKESILAQWPKEKDNGPRTVKDVKLISAGKILENNRTRKKRKQLANHSRTNAFVLYYNFAIARVTKTSFAGK